MELEFKLHVRNYKGGPCIKIHDGSKILFDETLDRAGIITLNLHSDMMLPGKILIEQYGKDMTKDTELDENGKIIDDKATIIRSVKIDDVLLEYELYRFNFFKEDGTILNNNYLGFNGKFVIDIDKDNLHEWHAGWQKLIVSESDAYSYEKFREEIFSDV